MGIKDPRTTGSNNPGATNVLRSGGRKAAILTLLGDALKGIIAVLLIKLILSSINSPTANINNELALSCAALGAFLGHLYPLFFGFKGGKGIATAFGVLLGISWLSCLVVIATWLAVAAVFRYSSLAALSAFTLAPFYIYWLEQSVIYTICFIVIAMLILWRHRSNIQKLLAGQESKIGQSSKTSQT